MSDTIKVFLDGKEFDFPREIADDDEKLRKALAALMPGAEKMEIRRQKENGVETIHIFKKAGVLG